LAPSARTAAPHRKPARGQRWPLIASVVIACAAIAIIYHLLRPTWHVETVDGPGETPLSIGGTLFNVTTAPSLEYAKASGIAAQSAPVVVAANRD